MGDHVEWFASQASTDFDDNAGGCSSVAALLARHSKSIH